MNKMKVEYSAWVIQRSVFYYYSIDWVYYYLPPNILHRIMWRMRN